MPQRRLLTTQPRQCRSGIKGIVLAGIEPKTLTQQAYQDGAGLGFVERLGNRLLTLEQKHIAGHETSDRVEKDLRPLQQGHLIIYNQ